VPQNVPVGSSWYDSHDAVSSLLRTAIQPFRGAFPHWWITWCSALMRALRKLLGVPEAREYHVAIPIDKMPSGLRFRWMLPAACKPSRPSTIFSGVEAGGFRTQSTPTR